MTAGGAELAGTAPEIVRTLAGALGAGMCAQLLAERLRIPAILLLLPAGLCLGPHVAGVLEPARLGPALEALVSIGVAVVLFEGSLTLRLADVRRWRRPILGLCTVGLLTTAAGATALAHGVAGLAFSHAVLFGALVSVTGPTVIRPLLRRVPVSHGAATVLDGEGILADVVGAMLAVGVLEIVIGSGVGAGLAQFGLRVLLGAAVGLVGAACLRAVERRPALVPDDLVAPTALAGVLALYAVAERLLPESGLVAMVAAGLVLEPAIGARGEAFRALKESLTTLFLSLLFVLLGAHAALPTLLETGWAGLLVVLALVVAVRPLCVAGATAGSKLAWRERLFLMGIAPRGVVAASVASLFALRLERLGIPGGERVAALVLLTVLVTVFVYGSAAAPLARALGVRRDPERTMLIVGANAIGRLLARLFVDSGWRVTLLDSSERRCHLAAGQGLRALSGSALAPADLERAGAAEAGTVLACTENTEVNALACRLARQHFRVRAAFPAALPDAGDAIALTAGPSAEILFGGPVALDAWNDRARAGELRIASDGQAADPGTLPVAIDRGHGVEPYRGGVAPRPGDRIVRLVLAEAARA